jgi:hypothetical protein
MVELSLMGKVLFGMIKEIQEEIQVRNATNRLRNEWPQKNVSKMALPRWLLRLVHGKPFSACGD